MRRSPSLQLVCKVATVTCMLITFLISTEFGYANSHVAYAAQTKNKNVINVQELATPVLRATANSDKLLFACQLPQATLRCYSPQQIATAYLFNPLYKKGITGKNNTIVIIDAFQSPTILKDLHVFDTTFGLPDPRLDIIAPFGLAPFDPTDPSQVSWSEEITLDVEWAHAVAPGAAIDLVLAPSNIDADLFRVTQYAVDNNLGSVISQSFGESESCVTPTLLAQENQAFKRAVMESISILAGSGDFGAALPTCDGQSFSFSVSFPASNPYVTAVGGTQLFANVHGAYRGEFAWNEADLGLPFNVASGGGWSTIYTQPAYQQGMLVGRTRGVPDVAYNAAKNGGVLVYYNGSFYQFGGTSAGTPQWAGIVALANQYKGHRIGFLNPTLYAISKGTSSGESFHDITIGNNTFFFLDNSLTITGYRAKPKWDPTTGLGTPIVASLVPRL